MKLFGLTILLFYNFHSAYGLTEKSKISILTYEAGSELYTIFGHTALRIQDSSLKTDLIYNFGTFDYSSPFFYIKFFGGKLDYFLTIIDYSTFKYYSFLEKRTVYEQTLDLTLSERNVIYNRLNQIYNSNERFYKYDFFYDNCATRIRDLFHTTYLNYDTSKYCCLTFRELLDPYISDNYWIEFGINLALGKKADKIANGHDFMFLPDFVFLIFKDSNRVIKTDTLVDFSDESKKINPFPIAVLISAILIVLMLYLLPKTRLMIFYLYNLLIALIGFFLLILSMFSENSAFRDNYNIIWTLPALMILILTRKRRKAFEMIYLIGLICILLFGNNLYTGFSWTFIPWMTILIIMYSIDLRIFNRIKTSIDNHVNSVC